MFQVLSGADLELEHGKFHMLLGPNGCGKSTHLRILGGLLEAEFGNFNVTRPVGFVFQNPDHQVVMPTVAADVAFGLGRCGAGKFHSVSSPSHFLHCRRSNACLLSTLLILCLFMLQHLHAVLSSFCTLSTAGNHYFIFMMHCIIAPAIRL